MRWRSGFELGLASLLIFVLSVLGGVRAVPNSASVLLPPLNIPAPTPLVPILAATSPLLVGVGSDSESSTFATTKVRAAREEDVGSPQTPASDESLFALAVSHLQIGTTLVPVHEIGNDSGKGDTARGGIARPAQPKHLDIRSRGLFGFLPIGFSPPTQSHPVTGGGVGAQGGKAPLGSAETATRPALANATKAGLAGPHRGVDQGQQVKGLAGILPALGIGTGGGPVGDHVAHVSETGQGSVVPTLAMTTEGKNERPVRTDTLGDVGPSQTAVMSAVPGSVTTDVDSSDSQSRTGDGDGSQRVDPISSTTAGSANGGPSELGQWKAMGIAVISITLLGTVMLLVLFFDKWWTFMCDVFGIKKRKEKAWHEQGEEGNDRWEGQKVWVGQSV